MPTLDELWTKVEEAAKTAVSATLHAADSARTSIRIAAQEERIKGCCTVLGKLYWDAVESGKTPDGPEFQQQLRLIREARDKIRQYRQQCPREEDAPTPDAAAPTAGDEDFEPESQAEPNP